MKIKNLIELRELSPEGIKPILQSDFTIHQSLRYFIETKKEYLPVYEGSKYIGTLSIFKIAEHIMFHFLAERERKYQLKTNFNRTLTKLNTLFEQIAAAKTPVKRNQATKEAITLITLTTSLLRK